MKFTDKVRAAIKEIDYAWNSTSSADHEQDIVRMWVNRAISISDQIRKEYEATNPSDEDLHRNWSRLFPTRDGQFYRAWMNKLEQELLLWKQSKMTTPKDIDTDHQPTCN